MVFLVVVEGVVAGGAAKNVCSMAALGLNPALVMSNTFVTYFSYHRPIVTVIPSSEATSNVNITKVTD